MTANLRITVRCFSHVRHALDVECLTLEVPPGSSTATVESLVTAMAPAALAAIRWRVALNREFVNGAVPLSDGDEVALIPPVQGG